MNKNAKEKQLLEEAYSQVLGEDWKKGTSKAPKGDSFDMSRGGAPSRVDAASDGPGGRYRRTRPPSAPSKKTHGEMEEAPEEDELEALIAAEDAEDIDKDEDKLVKVDDETEDAKYFSKNTPL
tara:strand:- start:365 stop:733 length:369 start_codon:yes stop_codon:yes gene_type:complete